MQIIERINPVSYTHLSNVDGFCWSADARTLYFTGVWHGESQVYKIELDNGNKLTQLTSGTYDYDSVNLLGENKLIVKRHSMSMGDEIYSIDLADNNKVAQLTTENKQIYDQLTMGKVCLLYTSINNSSILSALSVFNPEAAGD